MAGQQIPEKKNYCTNCTYLLGLHPSHSWGSFFGSTSIALVGINFFGSISTALVGINVLVYMDHIRGDQFLGLHPMHSRISILGLYALRS